MRTNRLALAGAAMALLLTATVGYSDTPATPSAAVMGSISGKVTTADQKPAVGIIVRVNVDTKVKKGTAAADDAPKKKKAPGLMATTDDKGEYKVENIPEGQYTVTAASKEVGRAKTTIVVTAGKNLEVPVLQLVPMKKKK